MKTIREILRLKLNFHFSARQIAQTTGCARSTVGDFLGHCQFMVESEFARKDARCVPQRAQYP